MTENLCNFAQKRIKTYKSMEGRNVQFTHPIGTFRDSLRAYREYKKEWRAKMDVKLAKMEEEIQRAKADSFYKVEVL